MSTQVQIRRGNTAQTASFTGSIAELTVDTDKKVVVVHDGTTAGGNPLIKANASITTGQILTSNGSHLLALSNTGTAGTYGNSSFIPVVTTDAYGRVSSVTNTAIAISSGVVTGVMTFAQGGANATSYTTGGLLTSNGTAFVSVANTGTAGTYANASHVSVITTDAYGRVSAVTNTAIAIDTAAITSGTLADARLPATGTAGTYGNTTYVPVITTDSKGRVTAVTNTAISFPVTSVAGVTGAVSNTQLLNGLLTVDGVGSGLDADLLDGLESASFANSAFANTDYTTISATAGVYGNASHVPVTTLTANGRVSLITNTAIAIDTSQLTSGTVADARLPTKGTADTYGNTTHIPVVTTDAYGRVTGVTNTAIQSSTTSVQGIVQLTDSISSTSTTSAATPNSVKTAYDLATTANTNAVNAGTYANAAFTKANSANVIAQAAFDNSNTKFNSSGGSITGDVSVTGNLTIIGETIYANTTTALIADNIITLNASINQASSPTVDAGFEIDRGSSANVSLLWNETSDKWTFTNDGTNYLNIADAERLDSSFTHANGAFTTANSATTTAQNAYNLANGTAGVANTDFTTLTASAGTYGNASHVTVTTLTANGRVSAITNTAIAIDTAQITSGTLADARLPATGTAGTYANASHVSVVTTDSKGRVTAVTNTAIAIDTAQIISGTIADARLPTKGTAGTYANASYIPVVTTDAYGRVSAVTNTLIQIAASQVTSGVLPFAQGGSNNTTYTTGAILTSNGTSFVALANTGTAGTYANASYVPVITTDAYGRVSSVTNTAIAITSTAVTGVMTFAQGGANATSYTTGGLLTSNGTAFVSVANTGTAGVYGNAAYHPVITTDAYGRVSAVTNTLVQIDASQVTSGVLPFAQGGANATTYTTGAILTSNGTAFVALSNTGTAGTYANAAYVPVITTDAYGRVTAVTNTAVAIDTSALTSGTLADARLPTTGTAGTYANSTHIPVITTDAYGRVTAITNTVIQSSTTSVQGIVQLNDTVTSTSTSVAATANAVNATYNFVSTKFNSSGGTISGDTTVTGNLTIIGQTIYANTTTALIADNIITLNAAIGQASSPTVNAGIEVDRGSSANVLLQWNETTDKWQFTNDGSTFYDIADAGRLDSVFSLANGTAGVANTDYTTISTTAGVYGNAAYLPVVTLTANGRVSSITNTAIVIDTAAIASGTLDVVRGGTGVTTSTGTGSVVLNTAPTITSINVTNTTVSTSNTTGAITVAGGIGVRGNVSADGIIFPDSTRQTTAASGGGASIGDVLALAIALG
jgi:hypothetical protein